MTTPLPEVSVVIIGLNEERRLGACLRSVSRSGLPPTQVLYVDGGSTDRSVEIAKGFSSQLPLEIVELQAKKPSPGLGRNEGLRRCRGELVHFLDGDMEIDSGWLARAASVMAVDPTLACLCGKTIEINPWGSVYNAAVGFDWESAEPGPIEAPSGGGLFRREVLSELGAYRADLVAAEETELGWRIERAGYRMIGIDAPMAYHDLDIKSFRQYWRRERRGGMARGQLIDTLPPEVSPWRLAKGDLYVLSTLGALLGSALTGRYRLIPALGGLIGLLTARQALRHYRRNPDLGRSLVYGFHLYFKMLPSFIGRLEYAGKRCRKEL